MLRVSIVGVIDEHADLGPLCDLSANTVIDLGGVTRMNSFGVRLWLNAFKHTETQIHVRFTRCPPVMLDQANMISKFFGKAKVDSFYVPIRCADCEVEARYLATPADVLEYKQLRFHAPCERCNHAMEVDEWEEHYFEFLKDLA